MRCGPYHPMETIIILRWRHYCRAEEFPFIPSIFGIKIFPQEEEVEEGGRLANSVWRLTLLSKAGAFGDLTMMATGNVKDWSSREEDQRHVPLTHWKRDSKKTFWGGGRNIMMMEKKKKKGSRRESVRLCAFPTGLTACWCLAHSDFLS